MKKIIFVLGVSLVGFGVMTAQNSLANSTDNVMKQEQQTQKVERKKVHARGVDRANHRAMTAEQRVERLDKNLNLTAEQKKEMLKLYKKSQEEAAETRRANRVAFEKERNAILTPQQVKLLEVNQKHNRKDMKRSSVDITPEMREQKRQMMREKK